MAVIKEETEGNCSVYIYDDFVLKETAKKKELLEQIIKRISCALMQKDKNENGRIF